MSATPISDVIDNLTIDQIRAELLRTNERDIVPRSLLRGLLAREREGREGGRRSHL
jgi:hypothetical protein